MPIPDNPTIKIAFTGLLAFCFDGGKKNCQVGFLRNVADHDLRFKVFKVTPDSREEFDFSDKADEMNVFLNVKKAKQEGVTLYMNGPFTRDDTDDPNDFRWLVDIEGPEFHNEALAVAEGKLTPSFQLNNGLFYTAFRAPADIMRNGSLIQKDTSVATFIGANIYLDDADEAILTFGENDPNPFSMKKEDNVTYKIQVFVDCINCLPVNIGGDFLFYYDAFKKRTPDGKIKDIPNAEKFSIQQPISLASAINPENRQHPCGPAFGGKTGSFK